MFIGHWNSLFFLFTSLVCVTFIFNVYSTMQEILMPRKEPTEAAAIDLQVLTIQLPGLEDMDSGKDQTQVDLLREISEKLQHL